MKVEVVKIGKYDPTQEGKMSKYQGYCLSTTEEVDLPLTPDACEVFQDRPPVKDVLLYSSLLRGIQTAACLPQEPSVQKFPLAELREVPFRLEELATEEEFTQQSSVIVRQRFVESFVDDSLLHSRKQIQDRIEKVLTLLKTFEGEEATLISHSFLMKILEATVNGIDVFAHPELLAQVIPLDQKTFPFGGGFSFEVL